jgi:hypothetical protein
MKQENHYEAQQSRGLQEPSFADAALANRRYMASYGPNPCTWMGVGSRSNRHGKCMDFLALRNGNAKTDRDLM